MKAFLSEFKDFIAKGNVLDMAVGIIIGGAFTAIVNSLVADIITPILGLLLPDTTFAEWTVGGFAIGSFVNAVIQFLLTALVLFLILKAINKARDLGKKEEEAEPAKEPRKCPFCCSEIADEATKCPHCCSSLE